MTRRRVSCVFAAAVFLTACGGNGSADTERPLTGDEAGLMAMVQYSNNQVGGATVEVTSANTTTGESVSLRGEVDWFGHSGRVIVSANGEEAGVSEIAWKDTQIFERRRDLAQILPNLEISPDTWITRDIDLVNRPIDRVIAILVRLSSTEPDNAVLIQQKEGSAFVRTDTWRDLPVNVFRYGKQTLYWLDADTGELRRFEGNNSSLTAPVIVDVVERSKKSIPLPAKNEVIPASQIRELYASTAP